MKTLFFLYGIVFVLICMVAVCVSVCSYLVSHLKVNLAVAAFFFFDMLESSLVMLDEYLGNKLTAMDLVANGFELSHPLVKFVLSCGLIASTWALTLVVLDRFKRVEFFVPLAVFSALELASLMIPASNIQQMCFYGLRSIAMFLEIALLLVLSYRSKERGLRAYLDGLKRPLLVLAALVALVLFEDLYHLVLESDRFAGAFGFGLVSQLDWAYFVSGRNISENVMTVALAFYAVSRAGKTLALRFNEPPVADDSHARKMAEVRLDRFCELRGISSRERDVLKGLLEGKTNQKIADELFVSLGTVKAHVHSIYRKSSVNNRTDLLQSFWAN